MVKGNGWKNVNIIMPKKLYKELILIKGEMRWIDFLQQVVNSTNGVPE
jgi:hypothetical protein